MSVRRPFLEVFRVLGEGFEPVLTIVVDQTVIYPGRVLPRGFKIGGLPLERLLGGAFDVTEENREGVGPVVVIEGAHTHPSSPPP